MKEMRDPEMWYILVKNNAARDEDGELAPETVQGFLSFMVTFDDPPHDDEHVGYIYEIHLEKELRGSGLGSWLIMHAERIIRGLGIDKMMLTVFTCNDRAVRLYEHLGYTIDRCSPPPRKTRHGTFKPTYIIMSKALGVDPDWPKALDAYAFEPEDFEHYSNTYSYSILNLQRVLLANERADLL
jgi:ribosomal protein S18 acetylase RimI-like enzyme